MSKARAIAHQENIKQAQDDIRRYADAVAEGRREGMTGDPWLELCRAKAWLARLRTQR